ncbi:MAG TPA: hypothetical protein PLX89_14360 [Verrucomicrobiota bacterium]|nr:hypothetical protein [Verrucomicrobiales bacterium]HRI14175.1 hypothetical protein [Verrucomicrobiota bacterium]
MQVDDTVQVGEKTANSSPPAMPLDVASSGDSPEAARVAVDEAVKLFSMTKTIGHASRLAPTVTAD